MKKILFLVVALTPFLTYAQGIKYTDGNCVGGDCQNGKGVYVFDNGDTYSGDFSNGKFNGQGKYTYKSGASYEGSYKNHQSSGKGEYTYSQKSDKLNYAGDFSQGKYNGQGVLTYKNGEKQDGEWINDVFQGKIEECDKTIYDRFLRFCEYEICRMENSVNNYMIISNELERNREEYAELYAIIASQKAKDIVINLTGDVVDFLWDKTIIKKLKEGSAVYILGDNINTGTSVNDYARHLTTDALMYKLGLEKFNNLKNCILQKKFNKSRRRRYNFKRDTKRR